MLGNEKTVPKLLLPTLLFALLAALLFSGCDRERADLQTPPRSEEGIPTRSAEIPDDPRRIVSLAPNITELLFTFDLGDRIVGVTRYCDWPPEAETLNKIGGMLDPDYEAILAAEPDLVLGVSAGSDHQIVRLLDGADVAYGFLEMENLADILQGIHQLGEWLHRPEEAREIAETLQNDLQTHSRRIGDALDETDASVLLVYDQEPIVAAGVGAFGDELLTLAGLSNAVDKRAGHYPILDMEQVLSLNPTIILDVSIGPSTEEVLAFWDRFEAIDAVQNSRIIHIDDPVMMRPGPRLPEALRLLGEALEKL